MTPFGHPHAIIRQMAHCAEVNPLPVAPDLTGLYERFVRLVRPIAHRLASALHGLADEEDLAQTGRLALAEACRAADAERNATFGIYVRSRIRGAMLDSVRGPEYREALREARAVRRDGAVPERTALRPGDTAILPDPWLRDRLRRRLAALPAAQARVMACRYLADLTQSETAAALGITKGTAAGRERAALARLRRAA